MDAFAEAMFEKLHRNRHKVHWSTLSLEFLMGRLREELIELEMAVTPDEVMDEAVDVANFALMIFDVASRRGA